jgi:TonB family protein
MNKEADPEVILTAPTPAPTPQPTPAPALTPTELLQKRLAHARALAIIGNYVMATSELIAVRTQATDSALRDVASIMLIGIQVKTGSYAHAGTMLQESFNARAKGGENSTRVFFALTGQMLRAVRSRLEHYHEFGVMTTDAAAPEELRADLDGMRNLLEQAVEEAQAINDEEGCSMDSAALIEDAASLRMELARDSADRIEWQGQVAEARVQLATPSAKKKKKNSFVAVTTRNSSAPAANENTRANAPAAVTNPPSAHTATANNATKQSSAASANNEAQAKPDSSTNEDKSESATPVARQQVVAVGSLTERATQRVAPSYPQTARNARIAGTVTVYVIVDERGMVRDVQNATGPDLLRGAALDAARRWRFQPTYINGQPVRVSGFITFNFSL